jgi:cytosine/creatinine deaminase
VPWGVKEGLPANFVVFDCADEAEAIRLRPAARWVVRHGRIVAETEPARSTVHVDGTARPVTFRRDPVETAAASPEAAGHNGAAMSRARSEEGVDV